MNSTLTTMVFVPLVGFLIYRRFRRSFGPQRVRPKAMIARMVFLAVFCALFLFWLPTLPGALAATIGGSVGLVLALFAVRHATYETTAAGAFYTPNRWIGMAVMALFFGRLGARAFSIYQTRVAAPDTPFSGLQKSPFTLGVYFLLAAYYIGFYAGVLRHRPAEPEVNRETA